MSKPIYNIITVKSDYREYRAPFCRDTVHRWKVVCATKKDANGIRQGFWRWESNYIFDIINEGLSMEWATAMASSLDI